MPFVIFTSNPFYVALFCIQTNYYAPALKYILDLKLKKILLLFTDKSKKWTFLWKPSFQVAMAS